MTKPALGVIFHPTYPLDSLIDYAQRAEAAGFDELWLWEDCFWAGALTSAAVALASTKRIRVGIGIMPATVRNPLFAAMEFATLAGLYPGRFIPGFGHGVSAWMTQIGAAPKSSLAALEETTHTAGALAWRVGHVSRLTRPSRCREAERLPSPPTADLRGGDARKVVATGGAHR
jgi:5,10-methylenetetrahydromethanopterin reductase